MIYITGDTHAEFNKRMKKSRFNAAEGDYLIICGDFGGVWGGSAEERHWLDWLNSKPYKVLFIDGNHENFDILSKLPIEEWNGGKVRFVRDNVIHLMRGQVYTLEGKTFFTMGGASSHDISDGILEPDDPQFHFKARRLDRQMALYRINHISWWKEELPNGDEYTEADRNLDAHDRAVDFIITHCAPKSIHDIIGGGLYGTDYLVDYLETVYQSCSFDKWFFGHYHDDKIIGEKMVLLYEKIVRYDTLEEYRDNKERGRGS